MPQTDDVPPLADPAHDATRSELARLLVLHKGDIGLAGYSDAAIAARVDDIMWELLQRVGRAELGGDAATLRRLAWFTTACDRLQDGWPAVKLDG